MRRIKAYDYLQTLKVSIHAPVKDATNQLLFQNRIRKSFNPRTRKGCDTRLDDYKQKTKVSIHAPVKDATE